MKKEILKKDEMLGKAEIRKLLREWQSEMTNEEFDDWFERFYKFTVMNPEKWEMWVRNRKADFSLRMMEALEQNK